MEKGKEKAEYRAAAAMLQEPVVAKAGSVELLAAPPSMATLLMVSQQIALLPVPEGEASAAAQALRMAKDCAPIGRIAAILALGAKEIRREGRWWRRLLPRRSARIARRVMEELTPKEASSLITQMLASMELGDFFALTAFLGGISKTKPTKAV